MVGEENKKLIGYLAATPRELDASASDLGSLAGCNVAAAQPGRFRTEHHLSPREQPRRTAKWSPHMSNGWKRYDVRASQSVWPKVSGAYRPRSPSRVGATTRSSRAAMSPWNRARTRQSDGRRALSAQRGWTSNCSMDGRTFIARSKNSDPGFVDLGPQALESDCVAMVPPLQQGVNLP
jgi:hypothetical protein